MVPSHPSGISVAIRTPTDSFMAMYAFIALSAIRTPTDSFMVMYALIALSAICTLTDSFMVIMAGLGTRKGRALDSMSWLIMRSMNTLLPACRSKDGD